MSDNKEKLSDGKLEKDGIEGKLPAASSDDSAATSSSSAKSDSSGSSSDSSSDDESADLPRGKSAKTPWINFFQSNRDLSLGMELEQYEYEEIVQLSEKDVDDTKTVWKGTLIGYVVGKPTGSKDIEALRLQWKVSFQFMKHPSGWTIFRFETDEQKHAVLANGPYNSSGFPWILKDIPPFFSFGDESFSFIPVWITLPGLPMESWNKQVLSRISSQVGKPITTDKCTRYHLRVSFARVLVEIDATKSLVRTVKIKMPNGDLYDQPVLYEFEPKLCNTCKKVGHSTEHCRSVKRPQRKPIRTYAERMQLLKTANQLDGVTARHGVFKTANQDTKGHYGVLQPRDLATGSQFSGQPFGQSSVISEGSTHVDGTSFGPSPSEAYSKKAANAAKENVAKGNAARMNAAIAAKESVVKENAAKGNASIVPNATKDNAATAAKENTTTQNCFQSLSAVEEILQETIQPTPSMDKEKQKIDFSELQDSDADEKHMSLYPKGKTQKAASTSKKNKKAKN